MITFIELIALLTFIGMGAYIIYLQQKLTEAKDVAFMMLRALNDVASGDVELKRTGKGIEVHLKKTIGGGTHGNS